MRHYLIVSMIILMTPYVYADSTEAEIADFKDWSGAIAFYVDAPTSIRKEMGAAVFRTLELHPADCREKNKSHWLCSSKKFRYLRGITGAGNETKSGFLCPDEHWISRQRYYPQQMMLDDGCLQIIWNHESKTYELQWP